MSNEKKYNSFSEYMSSDEMRDYFKKVDEFIENYKNESEKYFQNLNKENQVKCFMHVVGKIYQNEIIEQGSYRTLLYDVMGFDESTYALGMDFGLMELHNSIHSYDEMKENLKKLLDYLKIEYDNKSLNKYLDIMKYGFVRNIDFRNKQLKMDFGDKDAI